MNSLKSQFRRRQCTALVLGLTIELMVAFAAPALALPLPRPRPSAAGAVGSERPANKPEPAEAASADEQSQPSGAPTMPQPSACRLALTEATAIAPSLPPIRGPGSCGGEDIVRLEAVVLADARRVPLKPAATMRCTMATEVVAWVRDDLTPIAAKLNTVVSELDNFDSFDCRGRNRVAGARLSEHGRANALDVRAIKLGNGLAIALTDPATPREVRESLLNSVCARFTTVLGPGSDGYHEDHVHLDRAERRGGYRICQWQIWDSWPRIAPLMPAARPDDAPRRQQADQGPAAAEDESDPRESSADGATAQSQPTAGTDSSTAIGATKGARNIRNASRPAPTVARPAPHQSTRSKKGAGKPAPLHILRPALSR